MGRYTKNELIIIILLALIILFPRIKTGSFLPDVRLDFFYITMIFFVYFMQNCIKEGKLVYKRSPLYIWFFVYMITVYLSITFAVIFKGQTLSLRDFMEFIKVLQYFFVFFIAFNLSNVNINKVIIASVLMLWMSAIFGFFQRYNILGVNIWLTPFYTSEHHLGDVTARIIGTTANPNEFGLLMIIAIMLTFSLVLLLPGLKVKIFYFISFLLFSTVLLFTLSRTSMICVVLGISYIIIFKYPRTVGMKKTIINIIPVIIVIIISAFILFAFVPDTLLHRMSYIGDRYYDMSWAVRLHIWEENFNIFLGSPVFGWGPGKASMSQVLDSEWLLLLRRYGIVGVTVFVAWFSIIYIYLNRIPMRQNTYFSAIVVALSACLIVFPVYMINLVAFHNLQIMPLYFLYLGLAFSANLKYITLKG